MTTIHKDALFPLAATSRWFRSVLRNEVYADMYLSSPEGLNDLVTHLETYSWEDQECAIQSLSLRWEHRIDFADGHPTTSTSVSRREAAGRMTQDLQLLLQNWTDEIQELTLDFPGSAACLQDALLGHHAPLHKHRLKKLSIRNGGRPIFPHARHLFCAISLMAWDTLETLKVDGGTSALDGPWVSKKLPEQKFQFPSGMFSRHPRLEQLRHVEVRNLAGFYDEHLLWLLSGVEMLSVYRRWSIDWRSHSLTLEGNPHITREGIVAVLEAIGDGLEELRITHLQKECMPGYSPPPPPRRLFLPCYWGWYLEGGFQLMGNLEQRLAEDHLCDVIRYYCRNLKRLEIYAHSICRNIFFPPPLPPMPPSIQVASLRLPSSHGDGEATLCRGEPGAVGLCAIADEAVEKGVVNEFVRIKGFWKGKSRFRFKKM